MDAKFRIGQRVMVVGPQHSLTIMSSTGTIGEIYTIKRFSKFFNMYLLKGSNWHKPNVLAIADGIYIGGE